MSFIGMAGNNLVIHRRLTPDGVGFRAGAWPTNQRGIPGVDRSLVPPGRFANGPDGALYIADLYREILDFSDGIPESIKRFKDLNRGNDRGRIYRVVPEGFKQPAVPNLDAPAPRNWSRRCSIRTHGIVRRTPGSCRRGATCRRSRHWRGWRYIRLRRSAACTRCTRSMVSMRSLNPMSCERSTIRTRRSESTASGCRSGSSQRAVLPTSVAEAEGSRGRQRAACPLPARPSRWVRSSATSRPTSCST